MIEHLPSWINFAFIGCWVYTMVIFYYSNGKPNIATLIIFVWSIIHSLLAYSGFYHNVTASPPRFVLVLLPSIVLIIYSIVGNRRDSILKNRNTKISNFLHLVRFPMEIILLHLYLNKMIPRIMTFEGLNFDIIAGITAPLIGYFFFKNKLSNNILLAWNIIGLVLILTIFIVAILSAELPIQQFGFDQPNVGVAYFPFILLPATIVPIVLWTHITDILKLIKQE